MLSPAEFEEATIAAIATPPGVGGIGIIRVSGSRAAAVLARLFRPAKAGGEKNDLGLPLSPPSHQLRYGWIVDPSNALPLDEVMAVYMAAPATYTREDVVEIHCHGSYVVLREILALILAEEGLRAAQPGEFTKRAFLHGRIDLTRAEAVLDLLNASTRAGLDLALNQLRGGLDKRLSRVREVLLRMLAIVEVLIDFPEDGGELLDLAELAAEARELLLELLRRARHGRVFREGAKVVILGRPNVGKSSLLNALLGEERAIVTTIAGTTRDTIEEGLNIHGLALRIIDTAGIRETTEIVEELGVERSRQRVAEADLVLLLVEAGAQITPEDLALRASVAEKKVLVVVNKIDLLPAAGIDDEPLLPQSATESGFEPATHPVTVDQAMTKWAPYFPGRPLVGISAYRGDGLAALEDAIFRAVSGEEPGKLAGNPDYACVPNARHEAALVKTLAATQNLLLGLAKDLAPELLAVEIQDGLGRLGEITGETTSEDLLNGIFSRFCIGK